MNTKDQGKKPIPEPSRESDHGKVHRPSDQVRKDDRGRVLHVVNTKPPPDLQPPKQGKNEKK